MSNVEIKICGITSEEAIVAASEYKYVKYLGFVTYSKSKRHLTIERTRQLTNLVPKHIKRVSVLVGVPTDDFIEKTQNMYDYFQVYDAASPSQIQQLKLTSGKKVIVAIKAKDQKAVDLHKQYIGIADSFLFDGSSSYGTSSSFNWDYLKSIKSSFFLAGGIGIENISNALEISSKVDISSNLEEIEGKKSVKKIEEFLLKVKEINENRTI